MESVDKSTFAKNAIWKMAEIVFTRGITTIISIVLARILLPADYGIIAFTSVFLNISTMIVQGGIDTALIRLEKVTDEDYSNAFLLSLVVSGVCYLVFFISAPSIARFYEEEIICPVIRVQMLSLFLCSFSTVRTAIITRNFQFKKIFYINGIANLVGGLSGVAMAYAGFGVWALVYYALISNLLGCILMFFVVRWKMIWKISLIRIGSMLSFSSWILLTSLLDFCGNNIFNTLFGKKYSMTELGYYSKGNQLPELVCLNTYGALTSVLLPTLSIYQNDEITTKIITRKMVRVSSYVIFPMMAGLSFTGNNLIRLIFGIKWLPCVPILWASTIYYGVNIFRQLDMQILYAKGKSKLGAYIHLIRFLLLVGLIIVGTQILKFSVYQMAFAGTGIGLVVVIYIQYYIKKIILYGYLEWLEDMTPAIIMTALMSLSVWLVGKIEINYIVVLTIQIITGVVVYILLSVLLKNESYKEIKDILKGLISRRKGND